MHDDDDKRTIERLILVFDANAGPFSALVDSAKKLLRINGCSLCALTHGQGAALDIAFDHAIDPNLAVALQVTDNLEIGAYDRHLSAGPVRTLISLFKHDCLPSTT